MTLIAAWTFVLARPVGSAAQAARPSPLRDEDVVARVNGVPIERRWVREVVQGTLAAGDIPDDRDSVDRLAAGALESLIGFELLYQDAQTRKISVSDAEVEEEMRRARVRYADGAAFDDAMRARGLTKEALRRDTRRSMVVSRLIQAVVFKDVRVSDDEIAAWYARNAEAFRHGEQTRLRHILFRVPESARAADRDAARQKAESLLAELRSGAEFAELARKHSQDPGSAAHGGDLGFVDKGDLPEALEAQAFALAPGSVSGVISTPFGFHIIQVTSRRSPGRPALDEVHDRIAAVLLDEAREKRQDAYVAELRTQAKVEYSAPL